ncbi:MAG: murein biosynthesis integral membrane protein MurJ [Candidatus Limnocylindrales bacterium]
MSSNRTLARAGILVSGAFLTSRVLGWVRVVVIGNAFGASAELDAFYAAFRIPDLIFQLVAAGALSSALIPILVELSATDAHDRAWRMVSTIVNLILIGLAVLGGIVFVAAPVLVRAAIAPGFGAESQALTVDLTRIMLLSATFLALGSVMTSILNAHSRFAASAVAPIVYNLAIIVGALVLAPSIGVTGLAVAVVIGALGHLAVQYIPVRAIGFRWLPVIDLSDPAARRALVLMAPRAIGLGASQITFVVVTALATTLEVGAVTAFTIAFTLLQIPIGVIGVPLGIVLFPSLSREIALGNREEFAGLLTRAMRAIVFVMIPVAALFAILRTEAVALLFGRFGASAVDSTASTLLAFSVGLVAHALIAVLARAFYARQDTLTPVLAAIGAVVVNTTLAAVLLAPLGLPGIALAIAVAAWLEAATLLILLWRRVDGLGFGEVGSVAIRTVGASAVAGVVGLGVRQVVGGAVLPDPVVGGLEVIPWLIVTIAAVGLAFGLVFVGASLALRITELRSIVGLMTHALRRPRRS